MDFNKDGVAEFSLSTNGTYITYFEINQFNNILAAGTIDWSGRLLLVELGGVKHCRKVCLLF